MMAHQHRSYNGGSPIRTSWREVRGPCPICGHAGWCRVSGDGQMVACRRQDRGAIRRIDYPDGQAWLHAVGGRRGLDPSPPLPAAVPDTPRAGDAVLDRVCRAALAAPELALRRDHRERLLARGMADADLDRDLYRSLPPASRAGVLRRLLDRFTPDLLLTVPGVVCRDGPHGRYLTLAGLAGVLVPVLSEAAHVVGLVVRPDDPAGGGKYRWLSSAWHGGPSPGARVHVPAGVQAGDRGMLVEGVLKANVAHALSGRPIVGLPGCWVGPEAVATLHALGAREVLLALDVDAATNYHVARAQAEGLARLNAAGFAGGLVKWDRELGKGLDDALLAMRKGAV